MKRLLTILVAGLLVAAIAAPALAWEFALTGEMEWRYRYFARQGNADLFGQTSVNPAGIVDMAALGLAGPVSNVVLVQGFSAKQADAQTNEYRVWMYPEIRINPAVRLRGEYWVTGSNLRGIYDGAGTAGTFVANNWTTNAGYNGWYFTAGDTPGNATDPVGMSVGVWEKFWATAQTPWGILAFGRRPFAFGLGWSTLHEKDADTESIIIVAPYGPLTFIIGPSTVYGSQGDNFIENSYTLLGPTGAAPGGGPALPGLVAAAGTDKGRMKAWHMAAAVTYRAGAIDTGTFFTYLSFNNTHTNLFAAVPAGPAQRDDLNNGAVQGAFIGAGRQFINGGLSAIPIVASDLNFVLWVNYFKYTNGRFFFNAEYDFEYGDVRKLGGRPTPIWADAWMLELGSLCGPAKLSLAAFYSSGQDRRGGIFSVTRPVGSGALNGQNNNFAYDRWSQFLVFGGRQEAIKPYVWLMGIYGAGNNSFDQRGTPTYADWLSYNSRLDYAVAANLNVWGSYTYAMRASNTGTPMGAFAGGLTLANRPSAAGFFVVPNVPDNYLGWEADIGVDWKLLEGLTFKGQFAYWQPGDWFKWAYIDYGSPTLSTLTFNVPAGGSATLGINPNRAIDPLIGFQGSLLVEF